VRPGASSVDVDVDDGTGSVTWGGKQVVLAAGAWLSADPVLRAFAGSAPLVVERQVQLWFEPGPAAQCTVPSLPCFIHFSERGTFYAIPGRADDSALKACRHHGGALTTPDDVDRVVRARDIDDVRGFLSAHMPLADGEPVRSKVCLYTNTPDENFLIGASPSSSRVLVLGGCSGHGYKMACVLGEIAADVVVSGKSRFDLGLFDLKRFGRA
jgi:glycine/D-amino acid oxidase-like deaminating enzyme